jgi:glycine cleavage system aminomethyltransferase T
MEYLEDRALLALQGPKAALVLQRLIPATTNLNKVFTL